MSRPTRLPCSLAHLLLATLLLAGCSQNTNTATPTPPAASAAQPAQPATAAVATPDVHSAKVAATILRFGGNAVDAAIAAAFTLAVTYPEAGNIGGGGFMLVHMDGEQHFLDYREKAPASASRDMYLDADGEPVPGASLVGAKAVAIPGTVAGMWAAHQRFGSLPWADLVNPAVALAANGFKVPPLLANRVSSSLPDHAGRTNFGQYFQGATTSGAMFRQTELARTLRRIAKGGRDGFYTGPTADLVVAQMQRGGGLISSQDMQDYQASWREPLRADWRDYTIVSAPPPSSGGFALVQLLKAKDALADAFAGLGHNSPQYVHLVAEIEKRVFADRAEYLGDPDFTDSPIDALIDDAYIQRRAAEVNRETISRMDAVRPGLESPDTTHFSIVDNQGNAVSNTYTINWSFGSGVVVEGAGFLLNNEMDDFSIKPGVPNVFGVVGTTANEIQPGKTPLSSMTPTLLLQNGEVHMVVGTPGGSTIFTSVFQAIVNLLDFDMTPQQAVAATRFHHQLLPPDLVTHSVANPLPADVKAALAARGYRVQPHSWEFGDLQLILRDGDGWTAASDPRGRGRAAVFTTP